MSDYKLLIGDCIERLKELPDNSVDAVVTDPPYGLSKQPDMTEVMRHWLNGDDYEHKGSGFMGKSWDSFVPGPSVWRECFRVLKPGGHLLSFFGSRTYDIGTLAIRLAGFEVRDQIMWVYGSGFPKSMDVSKAIDKSSGAEREVGPVDPERAGRLVNQSGDYETDGGWSAGNRKVTIDPPATEAAQQWEGWGTALKPAHEPIVMARKPITETVAANVLEHGTGAINVDGCRVGVFNDGAARCNTPNSGRMKQGGGLHGTGTFSRSNASRPLNENQGRWPANFIHDGSDEATQGLGEASRYFYCAKASKRDRNEGCDEFESKRHSDRNKDDGVGGDNPRNRTNKSRQNYHPTVKPTDLMRYLVRMVTPPNGTVLDPFTGSGSTGKACMIEGFDFVGCELSDEYAEIAKSRIEYAKNNVIEDEQETESTTSLDNFFED